MAHKFKVTLLGSRAVGKTSLAHWAVNSGPRGGGYDATKPSDNPDANKFLYQLDHPELGKCLLDIEDTPGFKPDPRNERKDTPEQTPPVELLDKPVSYVFCDDGVRKPGAAEPEPDDEGEEGEGAPQKATEKTELVAPGASEGVSALDALAQLDRQGFVVVYNSMDKDSFEEAKKLLTELTTRMEKPLEEAGAEAEDSSDDEPDEDEPPPEIPSMPIVLVATHSDAKKKDKKVKQKDLVTKEEGMDVAESMAIPFFETNSLRGGKHVQDVFIAVASSIQKVEDNLIWDKGPTCCQACCGRIWDKCLKRCCPSCCPSCCKRLMRCNCLKGCCDCLEGPHTCCGHVCCVDGCSVM